MHECSDRNADVQLFATDIYSGQNQLFRAVYPLAVGGELGR